DRVQEPDDGDERKRVETAADAQPAGHDVRLLGDEHDDAHAAPHGDPDHELEGQGAALTVARDQAAQRVDGEAGGQDLDSHALDLHEAVYQQPHQDAHGVPVALALCQRVVGVNGAD